MKAQNGKRKINVHQKKVIFVSALTVLIVAFVCIWLNVFMTSKRFEEKMDNMILGEDYFVEDIIITDKKVESDVNDSIHENYFFYYNHGVAYEYDKRMQVSGEIYREYAVGDIIPAYTTDHKQYSYDKDGILPKTEFRNNEFSKCIGVLLGVAIFTMMFFGLLGKKFSIHENGRNKR